MADNIIKVDFGHASKIRHPTISFRFPQLYRVTSMQWDIDEVTEVATVSSRPERPYYTLGKALGPMILAEPMFTAIDAPQAVYERGWLIVRHHASLAEGESYVDGMIDVTRGTADPEGGVCCPLFEMDGRVFSLMERPAIPGRPCPAIIFMSRSASHDMPVDEWSHVVVSGGQTMDFGALLHDE